MNQLLGVLTLFLLASPLAAATMGDVTTSVESTVDVATNHDGGYCSSAQEWVDCSGGNGGHGGVGGAGGSGCGIAVAPESCNGGRGGDANGGNGGNGGSSGSGGGSGTPGKDG